MDQQGDKEINKQRKRCRRDSRVELEAERAETGKRGDVKTLYKITRKLSGRFQNMCKPVKNEAGVLLRRRRCTG